MLLPAPTMAWDERVCSGMLWFAIRCWVLHRSWSQAVYGVLPSAHWMRMACAWDAHEILFWLRVMLRTKISLFTIITMNYCGGWLQKPPGFVRIFPNLNCWNIQNDTLVQIPQSYQKYHTKQHVGMVRCMIHTPRSVRVSVVIKLFNGIMEKCWILVVTSNGMLRIASVLHTRCWSVLWGAHVIHKIWWNLLPHALIPGVVQSKTFKSFLIN